MSNFSFLNEKWPLLAKLGSQAESYFISDSNASMMKTRIFGEQLIDLVLTALKVEVGRYDTQEDKVKKLRNTSINAAVPDLFDIVRRIGNKANHAFLDDSEKAKECLISIFRLAVWFYYKVTKDDSIKSTSFKLPRQAKKAAAGYNAEAYEEEKEKLQKQHEEEMAQVKAAAEKQVETAEEQRQIAEVESTLELNEKETRRRLIDISLSDAGWDVNNSDSAKLEYKLVDHKEKGGTGYADYVLFDKKGKPIAVVEAKKTSKDPVIGRNQALDYADTLEKMHLVRPVIFYTNGYEIYIWDDKYSEPRQIWGFYTLEDLEELKFKHKYRTALSSVNIDKNIAGRPYQIEGIKRVFEKYEAGKRRALLVMATGTGKTRTVIALTKAMMEASWTKRVLFLADRDELVKQAKEDKNSFKTFMPEQISVRFTGKNADNREATLYFATYQTMVNYYRNFSVGFFDLIICDESHRSIYQVYRDILDYFDAYLIGLTATPVDFINRNTYQFFDCEKEDPTFNYSVQDAWNHIPPYLIEPRVIDASTDFLRKGIKYSQMTEEQRKQLEEEGYPEGALEFDKEALEKQITNKDTNRFILKTLMEKGIKVGDNLGKTIIFARNKNHANLLDSLFNSMYPQYKGKLSAVIYSDIRDKETLIQNFKDKDMPRIAISVDLLDTGIDVPEVVNLVFAKPIYSKVKFWQMIGRGTRRCDNLFGDGMDKKEFVIFDCWKNFDFFEMHPKGYEPKPQKTSLQVRFELRCELLKVLSSKKEDAKSSALIEELKKDIDKLPEDSIEIKRNRKKIEQVKQEEIWHHVSDSLMKKLTLEIAPLMQWVNTEDNTDAITFDNAIYRISHAKLKEDRDEEIQQINSTMEKLAKLRTNLNVFDGKRELVQSLIKPEGWAATDYDKLEEIRLALRDLMKYKGATSNVFIVLDIKDTGALAKEISAAGVLYVDNMEPYEKRVKKAIEERLSDQLVIHKIRKGSQLSEKELESIHAIFTPDFVYSIDELSSKTDIDKEDITGILRKFVGVDEEEVNKRFEVFVQKYHTRMNATQIKTLEIIKNDIVRNKGISFAALFGAPYTQFNPNGVEGIFGKMADDLFDLIKPYKVTSIS